ncbi:malto-oligosyltrehalose trehalohydrolase [Aerosakkonemataceae cyanobacterium BLCC-F50]|uniref:Malto-oligosyltrehalose trehalohydrolase n=1 Tax=Floridaenema flaviceps BLCC-F50 TaxID=3153642 RepID=A0ABV4XL81_9CYAN
MVKVGANYLGNARCQFTVWAPLLKEVAVKIVSPNEQLLPMQQLEYGFWQVTSEDIEPGSRYVYQLEGTQEFPDPASYFQPEGVHKPSEVFDHSTFNWTDRDWKGIRLEDYIIYELHIGTFTPEGTFEAVIPRLTRLKELGINAIEIMPVSQFPGDRNWGYDGVYPYAVQDSYGGPDGFKKLINACHLEGIAVILDVVYNHLGPEGNYLPNFGPYFTKKYLGDWGDAPNLDFAYCDGVREYFLENALYWLDIFHVDALRLDAVQGIYDLSAKHFLEELAERVHALSQQKGRKLYLTAESDFNDVRIIRPKEVGGYGLDAQWCDDFHHSLHTLITGEQQKYYKDFGKCKDLEKSLREGFVYSGQYSPDRKRRHGNSSAEEPAYKFIVCAQNHDQTGNRILGERMTKLTSFEGLKLTAGTLILSPFIPLLFMGEEYGEEAPFFYFISHSDPDLIEAVRKSKKDEFLQAGHEKDFQDPQDPGTFNKCVLNWEQQYQDKHKVLWDFYQELIFLRRINEALKVLDKKKLEVSSREEEKLLLMRRYSDENQVFYVMNFSDRTLTFDIDTPSGSWQKLLDSADIKWMGPGATMPDKLIPGELLTMPAKSFVLYQA